MPDPLIGRCACGGVEVAVEGRPILVAACFCDDCQEAARRLEAEGGHAHLSPNGGTEHLMVRRDRLRVTKGMERLGERRLKPESKTARLVASCCGTAMLLDFAPGHWVDVHRAAFGAAAPPVNFRTMTRFAPAPIPDDGIPSPAKHDARFFARLLAAWLPMLLAPRAPRFRWPRPAG